MTKITLLGIKIDNFSETETVAWVMDKFERKEKFWVATPNPEMVIAAQKDKEFLEILNQADLAIPDGIGLVWAAKILGLPLNIRVTGTDLMFKLCQKATQVGWKIAFLGGGEGVAQEALTKLQKLYPGLVGMALEGPQKLKIENLKLKIEDREGQKGAIEKINAFQPDLLFVGFGMGKQERWVLDNLGQLRVGGAMVVGGAFDFCAGRVRRAPVFLRQIGLEWLWRLILEPWRWRRQLKLLRFIWLVLRERSSTLKP